MLTRQSKIALAVDQACAVFKVSGGQIQRPLAADYPFTVIHVASRDNHGAIAG